MSLSITQVRDKGPWSSCFLFFQEPLSALSPAVSSRVLQLQSGCQKLRDEGLSFFSVPKHKLGHLIVNDEHKVMYCYIPKVACTNLKRVFLLLTGKMNETDPLKLKSSDVHMTYTKYLTFLDTYSEDEIVYRIRNYRKVIFCSWSIWKIVVSIQEQVSSKRWGLFSGAIWKKNSPYVSWKTLPGKPLIMVMMWSFHEFVQFLLHPELEQKGYNEHWAPMSSLCHPCHMSYDFIGKYETLDDDVTLLLKEMSVNDKINFPERGDTYMNERTEDTMMDYFKTIDMKYLRDLWKLYLHDYILFGYPFPKIIRDLLSRSTN